MRCRPARGACRLDPGGAGRRGHYLSYPDIDFGWLRQGLVPKWSWSRYVTGSRYHGCMDMLLAYLRDTKKELAALDGASGGERVDHLHKALLPLLCAVWELAGQPDLDA